MVKIAVCCPIGGDINPLAASSYRYLQRGFVQWRYFERVGMPVEAARNMLTIDALSDPAVTHLFWVDSDMVYPPDALLRLVQHDEDFVGGLCHNRRHPYNPVIARMLDPSWGFDKGTYSWLFDFPKKELIEVDLTGGAFLLIRREVFEKVRSDECAAKGIRSSDYADWWTDPDGGLSEDLSFCNRARTAGFKIHVDTGLDIGHIGAVVIDSDFAARNRQFEYSQYLPTPGELLARKPSAEGRPVATVVITAHNPKVEQLRAAIQSALAQTVPVEVIVVDDGSVVPVDLPSPSEVTMPAGFSLRVVRHEKNLGIAAALNTGIVCMTTDWFSWLPCDDLFHPSKIEHHLSVLLAAGRRAGYTAYNLKTNNGNLIGFVGTVLWATMKEQQEVLAQGCAINGSTVLIHKSVFDKVGPFDQSFKYGQDWEMWNRIARDFLWHGIPDRLTTRREFGNLTERLRDAGEERDRRDAEDGRIRRMYAVRVCPDCGGVAC